MKDHTLKSIRELMFHPKKGFIPGFGFVLFCFSEADQNINLKHGAFRIKIWAMLFTSSKWTVVPQDTKSGFSESNFFFLMFSIHNIFHSLQGHLSNVFNESTLSVCWWYFIWTYLLKLYTNYVCNEWFIPRLYSLMGDH